MLITTFPLSATALKFDFLNWIATDPMPRDQAQSRRQHEPEYRMNTIDPMTGYDIEDFTSHPSLVDGNLTVYFETEETHKAYIDLPLDHLKRCLPYPATDNDDRGG